MAAKEAELTEFIEENANLSEDVAPGDSSSAMLVVSDSYENLSNAEFEIDKPSNSKKSHIHEIVRQRSQVEDQDEENVNVNHVGPNGDASTPCPSEESSGEQSDV